MKQYLISPTFPYDRLICADAGPRFAADMGWSCAPLEELEANRTPVAIIDNRITIEDIAFLRQKIPVLKNCLFALMVGDPYRERRKEPYYEFLFQMTDCSNVVYLNKVQPVEVTRELLQAVGEDRFTVIYHPFIKARCLQLAPSHRRSHRILFSGAFDETIYPERLRFYNAYRRNVILRLLVRHLWHPGYPDIGDQLVHRYIGDEFIRLLTNYRFMYVSGSRYELEFLKYRECAYAGCVPVGFPPATFPKSLRDCMLPVDLNHVTISVLRMMRIPKAELVRRATTFADVQEALRNPDRLNRDLDSFLEKYLGMMAGRDSHGR